MTRLIQAAHAAIARTVLLSLVAVLAVGCAEQGPSQGQASNNDFEIRAMIASDRQTMHQMDERLRRIEDQIQQMQHENGAETSAAPVARPPAPNAMPMGAPPAPAAPPPAPGASLGPGAPAAPGAPGPMGETMPPGVGIPPATASGMAGPESPPPSASDSTTIASAPGLEPGNAPASVEEGGEGTAEAGTAAAGTAEAGPEEGGNTAGEAPAGGAAEAGGDEGSAAMPGNPESAPPGGGEAVASVPPPAPENAPAEEVGAGSPPPRWPHDLQHELSAAAGDKGGAGKLYRSGLDAMQNRNYSAAVERFGTVQKKYPRSDLAEPAEYFSASALSEMGKYDQAILQYNDLVMRYPKGKYAGESLLREAQSFVQINDKIDARLTLQKLLSEHSGTPQAAAANAMMKNLESD
jgi:tol-pal system protein YbgF